MTIKVAADESFVETVQQLLYYEQPASGHLHDAQKVLVHLDLPGSGVVRDTLLFESKQQQLCAQHGCHQVFPFHPR